VASAFIGENGLRAGWSILIAILLFYILSFVFGTAAALVVSNMGHGKLVSGSPLAAGVGELGAFLAMILAAAIVGLMEHRTILDFNLRGPHPSRNFLAGTLSGFLALSALIGGLAAGGWLHFGPVALTGTDILKFAALWGITFLLVGCVEEGLFRCYLQSTLTRGINFWWALVLVTCICLYLGWSAAGNGLWGVYAIAILGVLPCFTLQWLRAESAGFWQAAWVTSTFFGFIHTSNNGENWIGVFAAAAIGFVFCVSVRVTGSAWWAIGCHFAWDWAETYFYGAADSGLPAQGHLLTTNPAGNTLWSGGTDGPEGSLLVLAVILLLLIALLISYRRRRPAPLASEAIALRTA
jgi:membrane protease YdiL (CAAX protease family)